MILCSFTALPAFLCQESRTSGQWPVVATRAWSEWAWWLAGGRATARRTRAPRRDAFYRASWGTSTTGGSRTAVPLSLLVAECPNRVDLGGSVRGDEPRSEGDQRQDDGGGGEHGGVVTFELEEQASDVALEADRAGDADDAAGERHLPDLAEDYAAHAAGVRAERHAKPDLPRALRDGVRQQAVEAYRGQKRRQRGVGARERGDQPIHE